MNRNRLILAAVVAVTALVLPNAALARQAQGATSTVLATKLTATGGEYFFKLSTKTVKKGVPITISFLNKGTEVHDLKFNRYTPKSRFLAPGQRQTFKVTFKKAGKVQYLCTIGEHALKGMQGVLTVK